MLELKELESRNLKRELETGQFEYKSLEARFAKQHKASESNQEQLNKKRVELEKATTLLTEANKAIKHKEIMLKQRETRVAELEKYVRQVQGVNEPQNPELTQTKEELNHVPVESIDTQVGAEDQDLLDGEIMGDDSDQETKDTVKLNKMQAQLKNAFDDGVKSAKCSADCSKKRVDAKAPTSEELLCVIC